VAELLAIMTLSKAVLESIGLRPDRDVAVWLGRPKLSWDIDVLGKVIRFVVLGSSGDDRLMVVICLALTTSKPRFTSPSDMFSAGVSRGKVTYHRLYGVFRFWEEGVVGEVLGVREVFHGLEIRQAFRDDSCSVPFASEFKVIFYHILQLFLELDLFGGRYQDYWGRSTSFAGS
jgi:hypothetical protein